MRSATFLLSASLLFSSTALGYSYDCAHIRVDKKDYNFKRLGGPRSLQHSRIGSPSIRNTTITVDICNALKKDNNIPSGDQCVSGTQVCAITDTWDPESDPEKKRVSILSVISIAGHMLDSGATIDPKFTRLNSTDDDLGGLRLEMQGGKDEGQRQKAVIDFLCDKERTGNEGAETKRSFRKRDDEDDDSGDHEDDESPSDSNNSLTYVSWDVVDDFKVLKLNWKTKLACADYNPDDDDDEDNDGAVKKGGWGFFTWFIVILFLGVAAYLIFGSWLNYNRYGARGWDLLPHGDTIRDVPYIFKDFSRKVLDTFSGGGSRGGYSAV